MAHELRPAERPVVIHDFLRHSHHGHYMPLAVLSEIEITRLLGMRPEAWKWRGILGVALLGAALSRLIYGIGMHLGGVRSTTAAAAFVLTSLIVLHPQLREFIA